ncbi:NAD(P)-dependent alcohol dehydrogenase [Glycomyces tarimensis]
MKAVIQERFGAPEHVLALADIDRPSPGPGQALIRMRATSVNTPDWIAVSGVPYLLRTRADLHGGAVRGTDIAGVVEATGEGVTELRCGDEVFGTLWSSKMVTKGTFAEYTVAQADNLVPKPPGVSFEAAAAAVMSGLTALVAMRETAPARPGMRVLINGASGGVGTFAVQIAKHYGADVTAVCGPTNLELVRELGADRAIDYTTSDFTGRSERYDAILDNVMNHPPSRTIRALAPGGILMPNSVGNSGGMIGGLGRMGRAALLGRLGRADVRFVRGDFSRERLTALGELLDTGAIKAVIDHAYPLEATPKAVAHMLGHHARGNVVITMRP